MSRYRRAQQRSATAAVWTASNPLLLIGEIGWETDTQKAKMGDGVNRWNSLSYITALGTGGGGISDGDKGDITVSGSGSTWTIDNDVVTYAKMQNVSATDRILGRSSSGAGDVEEIVCTAAGRNLLDDADAAAQRTTLGLGTLATQSGTFSGISSGTNTGDQTITLTGDVTGSGTGSFAATIANDAVTNAKLANMATGTIKGRTTAGTGDSEDLTGTQATALLDTFTSSAKGLAPASGGGTTNFLRADGTWAAPAGGGGGSISDGDKGDITVSGSGATWTIDNDAVTYAKMQNVSAASRVLGRDNSGSGDVQELTLGTGLSINGTTLITSAFEQLPFGGSGDYYGPTILGTSNVTPGANITSFIPFFVEVQTTFDRIAAFTVSTWSATRTIRLGVFNDNNGKPDTVKLDAGTASVSTTSTLVPITINLTLDRGWYWLAGNVDISSTWLGVTNAQIFSPKIRTTTWIANSENIWRESINATGGFATANPTLSGSSAYLVRLRKA
jgi:hypothetical protein